MHLRLFYLVFVVTVLLFPYQVLAKETLKIGLLIANKSQRLAYHQLAMQFEKAHPNISINYVAQDDKHYKRSIDVWLKQKEGLDVLYWQAGKRLNRFTSKGLLEPLDELWQAQNWQAKFPVAFQQTLKQDDSIYGLPYSFYQWGIYYKKSLFSKLNITVPETWDAFIAVCETLKQQGVTPIVIGGKDSWSVAAWFDYFNLRINGLDFHQQLMSGNIAYTNERVTQVFTAWKKLIDMDYFVTTVDSKNWQESLPYIYRDIAGMTLLGSFADQHISKARSNDMGFFRFPQIKPSMPFYEETPIEVFVIPKNAQHKRAAKLFLTFVGQHQVQTQLNLALGYSSPHLNAEKHPPYIYDVFSQVRHSTQGIAQYFDRDTNAAMSHKGVQIMSKFLLTADIEMATTELEKVRLHAYPQAHLSKSH